MRGDTDTRGARGLSRLRDPSQLNLEELLRLHPTDTPSLRSSGEEG